MSNMWDYRDSTWTDGHDLAGYDVEATDGSIGNVDKATNDVSNAYVVVDTGGWISEEAPHPGRRGLGGRTRRQEGPRRDDEGPDQGRTRL